MQKWDKKDENVGQKKPKKKGRKRQKGQEKRTTIFSIEMALLFTAISHNSDIRTVGHVGFEKNQFKLLVFLDFSLLE